MLKASIIGNLGGDPEMRYSADGKPRLTFSMATTSKERDRDGSYYDHTEWVRVTVFGARAENLSNMLHKGSRVYVDGQLKLRPWIDNQNKPRAGAEILASEVQFMSSRSDDEERREQGQGQRQGYGSGNGYGGNQSGAARAAAPRNAAPATAPAGDFDPDDYDQVPF